MRRSAFTRRSRPGCWSRCMSERSSMSWRNAVCACCGQSPSPSPTEGWCQPAGRSDLLGVGLGDLDEALNQIYGDEGSGAGSAGKAAKRSAGLGGSAPRLAKWLGDIRGYFSKDVVAVIQKDAIERKG